MVPWQSVAEMAGIVAGLRREVYPHPDPVAAGAGAKARLYRPTSPWYNSPVSYEQLCWNRQRAIALILIRDVSL
jgi:hypothetical protein